MSRVVILTCAAVLGGMTIARAQTAPDVPPLQDARPSVFALTPEQAPDSNETANETNAERARPTEGGQTPGQPTPNRRTARL